MDKQGMAIHSGNPSTQAKTWRLPWILGEPGLQSEILPQKES